MDVDTKELAIIYAELTDEELLRRYSSGGLIDIAYNIVEKELTQRGVSIPPRTEEPEEGKDSTLSLRAFWEGRASLADAFGLLGIIGGLVIGLVIVVVTRFAETQGWAILYTISGILYIVYIVFVCVSIWRCAWNTSWKVWGYLARSIVIISVIQLVVGIVYVILLTP